jgi:putative hydrolase of the HAD superfamily
MGESKNVKRESFAPAIEAVTFDAGGTLIEPWPSVGAVYAQVAREFGIECSAERLTAQFIGTWSARAAFRYTREEWAEIVRSSFAGTDEVSGELFDAIYQRFGQARSWVIYDDVIPTLGRLEQIGVKLAIISNWDDRLEPLLVDLGLATYFNKILVSSQVGAHKPNNHIFRQAAELLRVTERNILHVGDSWREDVEGARAAGFRALRIRRNGKEKDLDVVKLTAVLDFFNSR